MGQSIKLTKILYIITQGEMGGAQRYVFDLATNLPDNFVVEVAVGAEKKELGKQLHASGIKIHYIKNLVRNINPLKDFLAVKEMKSLIKSVRPDIVHLNSSKAGVLGSFAAHLAGNKNVIFTVHGFAFLEPKSWLTRKIYYLAEKIAMRFRKKVITISEIERREAIRTKLGASGKFITIHNGIKPFKTLSRSEARANLNLSEQDMIVGTIAHDYKTKDLPTLKKSIEILKSDFPKLKLVIIGKGNEYGEIPDARRLLKAFDMYVSSSIKEGLPYTIIEAATTGLPIVATAVGGVPEIVSESSALLVPPKSTAKLAAAIKSLILSQDLREKLSINAKAAAEKFTLQKMIDKTIEVYQNCLK